MGLNTDFNVTPYFDDFNEQDNFHRVLFKPAVAVQARELTQLQTILQNQIERFGTNVLQEGTIVKGGNFVEENPLPYVKVSDNNTANEAINVTSFIGYTAVGTVTGLRAIIADAIVGLETQSPNLNTLYVKYINTNDNGDKVFNSTENLAIRDQDDNLITTITVAGTADPAPIGNGYGVRCGDGVIFQKGHFVRFDDDITIVSKYDNQPDGVVIGFETKEEIINSNADTQLLDNANGFNNYNAPGADRIKLIPKLVTRSVAEAKSDQNFFTLQEYEAGNVVRRRLTTQYNALENLIYERDAETFGNYIVNPFSLKIEEARNSSNNELAVTVGPGIAYVEGHRVQLFNNIQQPFTRADTTETVSGQDVATNYGQYVDITAPKGYFDINTFEQIDLVDGAAATIGTANIRSLYQTEGGLYRAYLFNVKMSANQAFSDVRSIENSSTFAEADIILNSANNAVLKEVGFRSAVFDIGRDAIKEIDLNDTDYTYRAANNSLEMSTGGILTITLSGTDTFPYPVASTLNETQKKDIILTANETQAPYTIGDHIDLSGNNVAIAVTSANQLTVTFFDALDHPAAAMTCTGYYNAKRFVTQVNNKNLEEVYITIDTATHANGASGTYSLGMPDVYSIEGIWEVDANSAYSESGTNVTNSFTLNTNQRDAFYDLSFISAQSGFTITSGDKFLVKAKTFRKTNSTNTFFSIDSYPIDDVTETLPSNKLRTENIPLYVNEAGTKVNLRNAIDFRPYVANTAAYSTTIGGATENPASTIDFGTTDFYFPAPNKILEMSYDYYLGRIDKLIVDDKGVFSIITGSPASDPIPPADVSKTITLSNIVVSPFPSLPIGYASRIDRQDSAVYLRRERNAKNYTFKDIEQFDLRLRNLELYTSLTLLEQSATELSILDENGLDRFKSGILVDNFNDLSFAEVTNPDFAASIDTTRNDIQPKIRAYPFDLEVVSSTGVTNHGESVTLTSNTSPIIDQFTATNTRSCTTNFWKFSGNMFIFPQNDTTTDVTRAPDVNFEIDLETPFMDFVDALQEFVPMQSSSSTTTSTNNTTRSGRTTTTTTTTRIQTITQELAQQSSTITQELGDFVTDVSFNPFLRSRDIQIRVFGLRPNTRHYFYFDETDINAHIAPGEFIDGQVVPIGTFSASNEIKTNASGVLHAVYRIPAETFFVGDRLLQVADVSLYSDMRTATSTAALVYHGYNVSIAKASLTSTTRMPDFFVDTNITNETRTTTRTRTDPPPPPPWPRNWDPVAQTFILDETLSADSVVYIDSFDLYFSAKSDTNGFTMEIRETQNGYPAGAVIPFTRVHVDAANVNADDQSAQTATNVKFDAPVALRTGIEYAVVIIPDANDPAYRVWISRTGETDVDTDLTVNMDTNSGVLFTSTNNRAWTAYQDENLKFTIYRNNFTSAQGSVTLTNPSNEFLKIDTATAGRFVEGEKVYVDTGGVYLSGNVDVVAGNTTVVGIGTAFQSEYSAGEHIVVNSDTSPEVLEIASVANNTHLIIKDIPTANSTGEHFKTVTGTVSYYNTIEPRMIILDNSSAKSGFTFANNDLLFGAISGAQGSILSVDNLPISYMQPNMFRNNYTYTSTKMVANRLASATGSYSRELDFNDNNYLVGRPTFIKSRSNEINEDSGNNSFELTVTLESRTADTSPFIDYAISNVTMYEYFINTDTANEKTKNGNAEAKYITRKVELAEGLDAEDMKVLLTAYRPAGTDIEVWAKFQSAYDTDDYNNDVYWTKLQKKEETDTFSSSGNRYDFREIEYNLGDAIQAQGDGAYIDNGTFTYLDKDGGVHNDFKFFSVKVVFLSDQRNVVPRIRDLRALALV
jgi:hypothetical protein